MMRFEFHAPKVFTSLLRKACVFMSGIHSSTQMLWPALFVARLRLPLASTSPSLSGSIHCTCRTSLVDSKHRTMSRYSAPSKLGDIGSLPSTVNCKLLILTVL